MLIHVKLLQYASKNFTYFVPAELEDQIAAGKLVQVPLKKQIVPALVQSIDISGQSYKFAIKSIVSIYPFPHDLVYGSFLQTIGQYYQTDALSFLRRIQQFLTEKEHEDHAFVVQQDLSTVQQVLLTEEQESVCQAIVPAIQRKKHETFLLHGVTGSGKTEIYKRLAQVALEQGQSVILMLPEVSLALRFTQLFALYFPNVSVIGFHSAASVTQKKLLWSALLSAQPVVIVGVHMPVLLPIANLGLIIVDEEHDHGYQEKKHPKLHSRDMAILKASMHKIPIVLGSATPSLQSLYNVKKRGWTKLHLYQRFAGKFPSVQLVSMQENKKRKIFWITDQLFQAIQDRLNKHEQTIIFFKSSRL